MSAAKKVIVCGGNGFLGSRICKHAVARGWDVTSISRSGEPKWDAVTSSPLPPSWAHKVSWERGDILEPSTYAPLLKNADYVVHSMGILLEADYKGVISGKESPISGLRKAFAAAPARSSPAAAADPAQQQQQQRDGSSIKPSDPRDQFSYETMNRDSAVTLARYAAAEGASAFCYISAAAGAPVLPHRYISTKRDAEAAIAEGFPAMRSVFLRPSLLYDSSRKITLGIAAAASTGSLFNKVTGNVLGGFMGSAGLRPLQVEAVAQAAVEALAEDNIQGPVELDEIDALASRAWRKTML
ncbi:Uncharacterized protein ESCO_006761 [Escovopsis weberi]|uniref:NAD-dependent epimerase/dehydratase domain-containing protein n=1 Tax=Escovopsis weberi TaxID=150374 RepID=A0A0M8MYE9_ESCWE|nr:Uncharacterized protein ESCO_006761 [Escovopsis weberi]